MTRNVLRLIWGALFFSCAAVLSCAVALGPVILIHHLLPR